MSIQEAWQDMQDDKIDAGEPQGTEDEFAAYCKEQTEAQLACCSTYGCDGIMVSYNGSATFDWHRTGRAAFLNATRYLDQMIRYMTWSLSSGTAVTSFTQSEKTLSMVM